MQTVGETVATVEQNLLVARERELGIFRDWLHNPDATAHLLNVSGPPGVGKTTLVDALARDARMLGWSVVKADGHSVGASEAELVKALSGRSAELKDLVAQLNKRPSLVIIDTFEQLERMTTFLQCRLLPGLDAGTRIVIAGRRPLVLAWSRGDVWPKIVRLLQLEGFSYEESRSYLARRGVGHGGLIDQVIAATAGNPLALSLAADLIVQFGVRDFTTDPQWHLAARSLARRLLSEAAGDSGLIAAVEACSVVRIFDEATLYAITGRDDASELFDRLCRLSIVKPAANGLMLHDHVRATISRDLQWRRPRHHALFRQRALEHFKERLRTSSEAERGWLIIECFYLWENPAVKQMFFGAQTLGNVSVEQANDIDPDSLLDLHAQNARTAPGFEDDARLFRDAAGCPSTRIRIARDSGGGQVGFSMVVPLCRASFSMLQRHPVLADLVRAHLGPTRPEHLPVDGGAATTYLMLPVVAAGDQRGAVQCALFRELATIFGSSGTYLCTSRDPLIDRLLEECTFAPVARLSHAGTPVNGWALDLTHVGFEGWIQAVIDGRDYHALPTSLELENEILSALTHWDDPAWLAENCTLISHGAAKLERAEVTRQAIMEAFSRARTNGAGPSDRALRALELAYLKRSASHKQAMRSLSVSRATFYRLCRRGVRALAEHVARP